MKSWKTERLRRQARQQRKSFFKQLNVDLELAIRKELLKIAKSTEFLKGTENAES